MSVPKAVKYLLCALLFTAFSTSLFSPITHAATGVPNIISYQGHLTDTGGNPLGGSGANYYFKFSLWDSVSNGTKVWPTSTPGTQPLTVTQGFFNVNIGDTVNGYPDTLDYNFNANQKVYLQVEISSDGVSFETLTPRSLITSSAFAQVASSVNGAGQSSFGTTDPAANTVVTVQSTSTNSIGMMIKGFIGQVAHLFDIFDSSGNSLFTVTGSGNVGIGTTTPSNKLEVTGNSYFGGNITATGMISGVTSLTLTGNHTGLISMNNNVNGNTRTFRFSNNTAAATEGFQFYNSASNQSLMMILQNGNVGIGTTSPSAKLDIYGTAGSSDIFAISSSTNARLFTVAANGNVGIRTASPGYAFDVNGNMNASKVYTGQLINNGPWSSAIYMGDYNGIWLQGNTNQVRIADGSANYGKLQVGSVAIGQTYAGLFSNPTNGLIVQGNVGIGTTSPSAKLDLYGTAGSSDIFAISSSTNARLFTVGANGNVGIGTAVTSNMLEVNGSGSFSGNLSVRETGNLTFSSRASLSSNWTNGRGTIMIQAFGDGIPVLQFGGSSASYPSLKKNGTSLEFRLADDTAQTSLLALNGIFTGNVGIGTTTPSQPLHITKTTSGSGGVMINSTNSSGYAELMFSNDSYDSTGDFVFGYGGSATTNPDQGYFWNRRNGDILFGTNALERMRVSGAGNVGIGTANPGTLLDVAGVIRSSGASNGIQLKNNSVTSSIFNPEDGLGTRQLVFSTDAESMRIKANGNVGIGTTVPAVKLDVAGSINATGTINILSSGQTALRAGLNKPVYLINDFPTIGFNSYYSNGWKFGSGSASNYGGYMDVNQILGGFEFAATSNSGNADSAWPTGDGARILFRIDKDGKVGIGTTTPFYNLSTVGNVTAGYGVSNGIHNTHTLTAADQSQIILINGPTIGASTDRFFQLTSKVNDTSDDTNFSFQHWNGSAYTNPFYITGKTGYVGIGTMSPNANLEISGSTGESLRTVDTRASSPTAGSGFTSYSNDGSAMASGDRLGWNIFGGYDGTILRNGAVINGLASGAWSSGVFPTDLAFETTQTGTRSEKMRILGNGNVGVGTANPISTLNIAKISMPTNISMANSYLHLGGSSDNALNGLRLITFGMTTSATKPEAYIGAQEMTLSGFQNEDLVFGTRGDTSDSIPSERMRITAAGNVGIGTTTPSAQLTNTGTVRFAGITGAGANLVVDALGNVSVSSDERMKNIQGNFTRGLTEIEQLQPISFKWKSETGYDTTNTYSGFSAQNVQSTIPEAISTDGKGYLTLADRPIIAALVNAVKEIAVKLKDIVANSVTAVSGVFKHVSVEDGIQMIDKATGQIYCVYMVNGSLTPSSGACNGATSTPVINDSNNAVTPNIVNTPIITNPPIIQATSTESTATSTEPVASSTDPITTSTPAEALPLTPEPVPESAPVPTESITATP